MGKETLRRLQEKALTLTEKERAELALALVKSLDAPADVNAAADWERELVKRLAQIDAGTAKLVDRDELRKRMKGRLGRS
jgi:putative addiction module component (TIGR02574 family)